MRAQVLSQRDVLRGPDLHGGERLSTQVFRRLDARRASDDEGRAARAAAGEDAQRSGAVPRVRVDDGGRSRDADVDRVPHERLDDPRPRAEGAALDGDPERGGDPAGDDPEDRRRVRQVGHVPDAHDAARARTAPHERGGAGAREEPAPRDGRALERTAGVRGPEVRGHASGFRGGPGRRQAVQPYGAAGPSCTLGWRLSKAEGARPARSYEFAIPASGFSKVEDTVEARKPNRPLASPGDDVGAAELGRRVAENLRQRRKARGMSLDDLARSSGVSRAALSQIETCKSNPTVGVLWKIAVGLGVPFAELIGAPRSGVVVLRRDGRAGAALVGRQASRAARSPPPAPRPSSSSTSCASRPARRHASEAHAPGTHEIARRAQRPAADARGRRASSSWARATRSPSRPTARTPTRTRRAPRPATTTSSSTSGELTV